MKEIVALAERTIIINRNDLIRVKDNIDTNIYFIESGSVRVFIIENGEEQIIRFGYQNNLIVLLDSFLTNQSSQFYLQAIKKSSIKVITKKQLQQFLSIDKNNILWTQILENLILQQLEREVDLLTNSPKERYLRVLKRSPQLFQEIPNKHIANYLRMSAETLSRLKKS